MNLFEEMLKARKLEQVPAEGGTGGTPAAKSETPPAQGAAPADPPAQGAGDKFDEFGYEKVSASDKKPEEKPNEPSKEEPLKVEGNLGYGEKPPEEVAAPAEEKKPDAPPPKEEKVDLGYELDVKDLSPKATKEAQDFAKKNALTKEQAQAYVDREKQFEKDFKGLLKQSEESQVKAVEAAKVAAAKQRTDWDKELREDKTFGGENFARNVARVERFMSEVMPLTKKRLTETKGIIPPYIMRDLATHAENFYGTKTLVKGGDAPPPPKDEKEKTDPLDYYKS